MKTKSLTRLLVATVVAVFLILISARPSEAMDPVRRCWRAEVVRGLVNKPGKTLIGEFNYAMAA